MSAFPIRPPHRQECIPIRTSLDNSDIDYYKKRDALLHDSSRDIRIHNWISSQYDFALSESELDEYPKAFASSRADSPLLGYSDHSSPACSQEAMDSDAHAHPSYDTLFFPVVSQENLSAADYEFEERQREHALKSLIEDMTIWESLDPSRNKTLPPLPTPAPPCTPDSTPSRSRAASQSISPPQHSITCSPSRSRLQRFPSIISTLESVAEPARVSEVLYTDHLVEAELPTPTATPVPVSTRSPPPGLLNLFTTFETLRQQELAGEYPASPTMTSTTNQSTPALTTSSALSLEMPMPHQRNVGSIFKHEHHRDESFANSLVTISSGASPDTEEYMTPASDFTSQRPPAFHLTTVSKTSDSGEEPVDVAPHSHLRGVNTLPVPQGACGSRWSVGSSIAEDAEIAEDAGEKEDKKIPSRRRRLLSLISLLSPAMEKKEKEHETRNVAAPPSPPPPSVYLPPQQSATASIVSASTLSLTPPNSMLAPLNDNPHYSTSHSDSSLPSHPVVKMGSLASLGYGNRSLVKPKKRKLIVSGVGRNNIRAYEAVKEWCESFGEVRSMLRKENGEIHVDWRKSSVAETVCRIRAGVFIHGAGSVNLSWYTGKSKSV